MDITGYYQHESIFLPIFRYLQSINVDYRFNAKVKDLVISANDHQQSIEKLQIMQNGYYLSKNLGKNDIVIVTLGSSVSESTTGTNDHQPIWHRTELAEPLDENWSLWLALGDNHSKFGDPYSFCSRESESIVESFTITTGDADFFSCLWSLSDHPSEAGAFISLQESRWGMNVCAPMQPVFSDQPQNVHIIWGFATSPARKGNYVEKPMIRCSGKEIMAEMLRHLNLQHLPNLQNTVTIPRIMPRMTASLLSRAPNERPGIIPRDTGNIGLVGQFVAIPQVSSVDVSYGVRTAEMAVSRLMGLGIEQGPSCKLPVSAIFNWFISR